MHSDFIVRIVIYEGEDLYTTLHETMAVQGFKRTMLGSDKIVYELPHAEYFIQLADDFTAHAAFSKAVEAVLKANLQQKTSYKYAIFVTKVVELIAQGLKSIEKPISNADLALSEISIKPGVSV